MKPRRPSPQTTAVMRALGEQFSGWGHGYDLCQTLGLKAGTVYPILIRLAERGLVDTAWEQEAPQGRPARHLYRLSAAGARFLAELPPVTAGGAVSNTQPSTWPTTGLAQA